LRFVSSVGAKTNEKHERIYICCMLKLRLTSIYILCLLTACIDSKKENSVNFSEKKVNQINDFVPEHIAAIPQINLSSKTYIKHKFKNYVVDGSIDSANLKQGYWVIQDVKGNLTYRGSYNNDLLEGWWEVLSSNALICSGNYTKNKKQGYWRYLKIGPNENSKYVNYTNDKLNGLAREYTKDSTLIAEGDYINGLKGGYWKYYSQNGLLIAHGDYSGNYKCGFWSSCDLSGKIYLEANYFNDTLDGLAREYTSDTVLISHGDYEKGRKIGYWKYYYKNGILKEEGEYTENYKNGWWKSYDDQGIIQQEANYSRDHISGYVRKYLKGIISEVGQKINGRNYGTWKYYDTNGQLLKIEQFED
jgi:antitoxin component YwqK of YwqJK toxin-antitoxin module